ncbi:hypothetical protein [Halomicrobium mukohataei]|nr:hypothetical protein [Halomicrobium mukohataei]
MPVAPFRSLLVVLREPCGSLLVSFPLVAVGVGTRPKRLLESLLYSNN